MDPLCEQLLQEDLPGQSWGSATQILVTADKQGPGVKQKQGLPSSATD